MRAAAGLLLALASTVAAAQAVPPPGVDLARPPTERGLVFPDRSQVQARPQFSRDCKQAAHEIRDQYRIQQDVVQRHYEADAAAAAGDALRLQQLRAARDARIASLQADAQRFAAQFERQCRADNRETLRNNDELGRR